MHIMVKTLCCPFCDWANKSAICLPTSRESLVHTYLVREHPPLHLMQESRRQTTVCPATRKVDCSKKYFPIWAISKHIIHHCVAIIATIHCVLHNMIIHAFCRERDAIHETYDIIQKRFSHLNHSSIFPHLLSVGEFYLCKWMIPQFPDNFYKHPIYRAAANGWCDAKNKTEMFQIHCAPQIEQN